MNKILLSACLLVASFVNAQEVSEPEFVGETILLKIDNTTTPLEKELTQNRTVASTGLLLSGIGKVRSQVQIEGCCAEVKIGKNDDVKFIIRAVDNNTDPLSIIKVFKFEQKKKYRRAEMSATSNFGSSKSNNLDYISFSGKKYGESSYLIKLNSSELEPGEYGITISNPNSLDQKQTVISTFAVK
ncbi:hypothetical protein [Chishuiella sp.]|uniref:hypothetical protein n=1 Tax=Chishuiella sp. TaxID=1969467 RepID=UPI0028A83B35|nr:hypothetical protein [Chishuiella sp.]